MTLEKEIEEAINKNLPTQVGQMLQARLAKADQDLAMAIKLQKDNEHYSKLNGELHASNEGWKKRDFELGNREKAVAVREMEVQRREDKQALGDLRVSLSAERLSDMKELVLSVFANNKIKYTESSPVPSYVVPQGGSLQQSWTSGSTNDPTTGLPMQVKKSTMEG